MAQQAEAVNEQVDAGTIATESATVDNKNPEVAGDAFDDDVFDDIDDEVSTSNDETDSNGNEEKPEPSADETKSEQKPQEGEEKQLSPKSQNRFQSVVNERNELRQRVQELEAREAQIAHEQELVDKINPETGEYYTPAEIERLAFQQSRETQQQSIEQERYELQVQQNQVAITDEALRAVQEFPMFDDQSPEFDPELAAQADIILGQSLIRDPNVPEIDPTTGRPTGLGRIIGSQISPYQLYKTLANSSRLAAAKGQANAQKATQQMQANADVPSGSSQTSDSIDEDLKDFDEAWDS